ncbi:sensor histidine kinase [Micromonospora zhanjiangensis]
MHQVPGRPAVRIDASTAALVFVVLLVLTWFVPGGPRSAPALGVAVGLAAAQAGSLLWIRRRPEWAVLVAALAGVGLELLSPHLGWLGLVNVPLTYLARLRPPRVSLWALGLLLVPTPWKGLTAGWRDMLIAMAGLGLAWAWGELLRGRAVRRRDERLRIVADERARIARELHDVVTHNVSMIALQAGAAEDVFDIRPDRARESLVAIQAAAREALGELRVLLTDMRPDGAVDPAGPQPGLGQLDALVDTLRAAGLRVAVRQEGTASALTGGVDLTALRIVQESLTNTLRHARASRAEVTVRNAPTAVNVEITDDGAGGGSPVIDGTTGGHGIVGMRERDRLLGGTLDAGPLPDGGFRVRAHLPVEVSC